MEISQLNPDFNAGPWTAFTPTLSQWGIGSGTSVGAYMRIGKFVIARYLVTFAADSTFVGFPQVSLPIPATAFAATFLMGSGYANDAGTGRYPLTASSNGTLVSPVTSSPITTLGAAIPFAWGVGDQIQLQIMYEAA